MITIQNIFSCQDFFKQFSEEDLFRFKFELPDNAYNFWFDNTNQYFKTEYYIQLTVCPDARFRNVELNGVRWVAVKIPNRTFSTNRYLMSDRWFASLNSVENKLLINTGKLEIPYYRIKGSV